MSVQGVVQTYDPITGIGVIVRDEDRSEVYLRPGSLDGSSFLTLRQGQRIVFEMTEEADGVFASSIRFGQGDY